MRLRSLVIAFALLVTVLAAPAALAQKKHSAAWYRRHHRHSAAWYRRHRHHSAAWYRAHRK